MQCRICARELGDGDWMLIPYTGPLEGLTVGLCRTCVTRMASVSGMQREGPAQAEARRIMMGNPRITTTELALVMGVSQARASKLKRLVLGKA